MSAATMAAPKVTTRRAVAKRPREHDTGHVITGFGYAFECSCGERGRIVGSYREAMQAGREHAASHVTHGRHCPCTPCRREDWARVEAS